MNEFDHLIRDLEQRRSNVIRELQRLKTQHSQLDSTTPDHVKERIKRLEGQRAWLNNSIEKLIFKPDSSALAKTVPAKTSSFAL